MKKVLLILGTNRDESNTLSAIKSHLPFNEYELVDLQKMRIEHYSYHEKPQDDFLSIATKMTEAEVIVFATPVYWYSMSGYMKIFFDRLSDLITTSKPIGWALAGKKTYLFSTGHAAELPEGFEVPFKHASEYFGMKYQKGIYVCTKV